MTERRVSRRELALVACALLLPVPVLAASGLGIPLPSTVERGLASLLPLQSSTEDSVPTLDSGTAAATGSPTGGRPAAAVPESEGALPPGTPFPRVGGLDGSSGSGSGGGTAGGTGSEGAGEEGDPPSGDDTPPLDEPAPDVGEPDASEPASVSSTAEASLEVAVDAPGASATVSLSDEGVTVDATLDDENLAEGTLPGASKVLPTPGLGIP